MALSKDFREFIELLNLNRVKYLVVGGYALAYHGFPRYTKDIDIWIMISRENANALIKTLISFGFESPQLTHKDFLKKGYIIQLGYPPNRIDIMTSCDGVTFNTCYKNKVTAKIDGLIIYFISIRDLKKNKKVSGRLQDLADLEKLKK